MLKNKKSLTLDEGFERYYLALEYKSVGNNLKAINILKTTIIHLCNPEKLSNEVHLVAILQNALAKIYMEVNDIKQALYFFDKSILNIDSLTAKENKVSVPLQEQQILKLLNMALLYKKIKKPDKSIKYLKLGQDRYKLIINSKERDETMSITIKNKMQILGIENF